MNILYITADPLEYSSSANMRNIALIKGLIENGHDVSTLSTKANKESIYTDNSDLNLNFKNRYWIVNKTFININKEENYKTKMKRKIKKLLYKVYIKFSVYDPKKRLVNNIDKIHFTEQYDLIISSSDPKSVHLFTENIIKNNPNITKKWIQYWGDPFVCDINSKKWIPRYFIKSEEARIISKANKIVYVSPFTLEKQKKLYPQYANKMTFVPIPYKDYKIYKKADNINYKLGYFGDYNKKDRNIKPLYEAVGKKEDYELVICGNSNLNLSSKKNIHVFARQPRIQVEEYEKNTDLLICICNKKGTQIPGKVYHYAATNRPILIILDGNKKEEMKDYFNKFERYYMCYNDENSIIEAIERIRREDKKFKPLEMINSINISKRFI